MSEKENAPMPGIMGDGTFAPENTDTERLDWLSRNPGKVKNLKRGVFVEDIRTQWQPNLRSAIDAAMEFVRRDLRSNGLKPKW